MSDQAQFADWLCWSSGTRKFQCDEAYMAVVLSCPEPWRPLVHNDSGDRILSYEIVAQLLFGHRADELMPCYGPNQAFAHRCRLLSFVTAQVALCRQKCPIFSYSCFLSQDGRRRAFPLAPAVALGASTRYARRLFAVPIRTNELYPLNGP